MATLINFLLNTLWVGILSFFAIVMLGLAVLALLFFISMIKDWLEDLWL